MRIQQISASKFIWVAVLVLFMQWCAITMHRSRQEKRKDGCGGVFFPSFLLSYCVLFRLLPSPSIALMLQRNIELEYQAATVVAAAAIHHLRHVENVCYKITYKMV